jgi:hypothetical protein
LDFKKLVTKPTGQAGHGLVMTRLVTKATRFGILYFLGVFLNFDKRIFAFFMGDFNLIL